MMVDEEYIDLFVFSNQSSGPFLERLMKLETRQEATPFLRFSGEVIGSHEVFSAFVLEDLSQVSEALNLIRPQETSDEARFLPVAVETAVCRVNGPLRVKRSPGCPFEAFIRITFPPGTDLPSKLQALSTVDGYSGSCLVDGGYEMLLELGADDRIALNDRVSTARAVAASGSTQPLPLWDTSYWQPKAGTPTADCA
jgi:hypothetical protein